MKMGVDEIIFLTTSKHKILYIPHMNFKTKYFRDIIETGYKNQI